MVVAAAFSRRTCGALDLGPMHDSAAVVVERIAAMHGAAIVPDDEIADLPDVLPGKIRTVDITPELVEQRFGVSKLKPDQIGVATAAEIEHLAPRIRMSADQRVDGAGRGARIVCRRDALAQEAAAVVGAVVLDLQAGDALLQLRRKRVVDRIHAAERRVAT